MRIDAQTNKTEKSNKNRRTKDLDIEIGARIRTRRIALGLTQEQLARLIGVTYQQAHKYEKGRNRVAASRLIVLTQVLKTSANYLLFGDEEEPVIPEENKREALNFYQRYSKLPPEQKSAINRLLKVLSEDRIEEEG